MDRLKIDGKVEDVMNPLPLDEKAKAFGFNVLTCDGHDFNSIKKAFDEFNKGSDKPTAIIANTIKGKGVSFMENNNAWHHNHLSKEQYILALSELGGEASD